MAIKVMKRRANVQPVGVVKTDTFNANAKLAQDIANASTAMMGVAYQQGITEAKQRGIESAQQTQLTVLDPEEGFVQKVNAPESFGRIAESSFNDTMTRRYASSINHSIKQQMARLQNEPELRADPSAFKLKASGLIASYVESSDPAFKGMVQDSGTELMASALTNVTLNQHKDGFKKLAYRTENEIRTSLGELVALLKSGASMSDVMQNYNALEQEINDSSSLLRQEQYTSLMDDLTNNVLQGVMSAYSNGKTKSRMNEVLGLWNRRAYQEGNMPKEIQEVINALPQDGRLDKMHEEIKRHLGTIISTSQVAGGTAKFGSSNSAKIVDATMSGLDNDDALQSANSGQGGQGGQATLTNPSTGAMNFFHPKYAQVVRQNGHIGNDMSQFADMYMANVVEDPTGELGFGLYQVWANLVVKPDPSGRGFIINSAPYKNAGNEDFHKAMLGVRQYLDIDTNPEQFLKAWNFYNKTKQDKDAWTNALATQLGVDKNETAVRNSIMSQLENQSMSPEEASLFVDEVILYQAMSFFDGTNISTKDAIKKIAQTVNNDFKEDSAIINPNGIPAHSFRIDKIDNPNAGKVAFMGFVGESPEQFDKKIKMPFHQRTRFALPTVFDDMGFSGGADIFTMDVERIVKETLFTESEPPVDGLEEASSYKLGKDIFLMPNVFSTVENPQYSVLFKDPESGVLEPVIMNGTQMVLNVEDFKNRQAHMAKIGFSTAMKGFNASDKKILEERKAEIKRQSDMALGSIATSGMIGLNQNLMEGKTFEDIDLSFDFPDLSLNDEDIFDFFEDQLDQTKDFFHSMVFGRPSKVKIGAGIKSVQRFNPTNIRYVDSNKWKGSIGDDGSGFESFDDMASGFRATGIILQTYNKYYFNHEMTLKQMITRWAPPSENDTKSYIEFMEQNTGFSADDVIDTGDNEVLFEVIRAMTKLEIGATAYSSYTDWDSDIRDGLNSI